MTLADGRQIDMRMTATGVMISEQTNVEPIIPMNLLVGRMGYTITWEKGRMKVSHPSRGDIKVKIANGCPQISRVVALKIIEEVESGVELKTVRAVNREEEWLKGLVQVHPALRDLPEKVKQKLVVTPDEDLHRLPGCNRRKRRTLEKEGFVAHLYAGPDQGYTLARALKEVGGNCQRLVEIDILRGDGADGQHDMLSDQGPYPALVRAALDGTLRGLVMGPNCRTRSVLRHYPRPDWPGGGPVPVRSWQEPWGKSTNSADEQKKVEDDDILMWRGLMLFVIHEEVRRAVGALESRKMILSVEQPADPTHYMPEVVTFWKTDQWLRLRNRYELWEQTFNQACFGGLAEKPTTFGGNLLLNTPKDDLNGDGMDVTPLGPVQSSKELARWAPGLMKEVATQLQRVAFMKKVKFMKLSWDEHVQRGHTPFRRDCQICQEAAARGKRHMAIEHPRAGVLSLDVAGPLKTGHDVEVDTKFMLIGTYTWLLPAGATEDKELPEEEAPDDAAPEIHEGAEEDREEEPHVGEGEEEVHELPPELPLEDKPVPEERVSPRVEVIRVGVPITGKSQEAVLAGMIEIYLQLRVDGFPVHTVHTDRGREFTSSRARLWMRSRSLVHSTTAGEDPMANGRVEKAVGETKKRLRRMLHGADMGSEWWPMALRYMTETDRMARRGEMKNIPPFGQKILIKKRIWRQRALDPTHEEARYLTPLVESHGHCVLRGDGRWGVAPYVIRNVEKPPPPTEDMWLAILEEHNRDEVEERRRIRGKQPIRHGGHLRLMNIQRVMKEEAANMDADSTENAMETFKSLDPWRHVLRKAECEEEEILQTRIVGVEELVKDIHLWDEAIKSELTSLFEKKEALRRVFKTEREQIKKEHPEVMPLPAKLVITRKAGGKRKVRIVACGNYADKKEGEDLYASGSDCISLRLALRKAVDQGWEGATADVRTAFLNAPLAGTAEDDSDHLVLISPPRLLIRLGYARQDETWLAIKAMYGLRQSPKAWSDYRDSVVAQMEWEDEGRTMSFCPLVTDPNVWKITASGDGLIDEARGLMLVYVDDLLILGPRELVQRCLQRISQEWELSKPEWLNELSAVRFLGMGIMKVPCGVFLNQEDYIRDVLRKNGEELSYGSGVPITKDQTTRLEEEGGEKDAESIRLAQKATGELMWVATRTRPDLMFTLSCMSRYTLKSPAVVVEVGAQARRFLKKTIKEGILMKAGESLDLEVYSDSSYGPGGLDSQGAVLVMWGASPMMWKAGKQGYPSLSTAESELGEAMEAVVMGDAVDCMVQEISGSRYGKVIRIDNHAAVNLLTEPSGSWRTRHLRLRASHMRWRLGRSDWLVQAVPGAQQLADIGTKVMTAPKLLEMRRMMNVQELKCTEALGELDEKVEAENGYDGGQKGEAIQRVAQLVRIAAILGGATGVNGEDLEKETAEKGDWMFLVLVIFAVIGVISIGQSLWKCGWWMQQSWSVKPEILEEKLMTPVHGRSPGRLERSGALVVDDESDENALRAEEVRGGEGEVAAGTEELASLDHGRPNEAVNPEIDSEVWKNSRVIITPCGEKYHLDRQCPTLNLSRKVKYSPWCQACAERPDHRGPVFTVGPGKVVHTKSDCPRIDRRAVGYLRCLVCSQREQRLEQARTR